MKEGANGTFVYKNVELKKILVELGQDTKEVWDSIGAKGGSVQDLDFLDDDTKEVFLTMEEINQFELIEQAAIRQDYIDQGASLNINIPPETPADVRSKLYLTAHKFGVKAIYYQRSKSISKQGLDTMDPEACASCSG
jgi:ribonucleoside-diphosphate reductase alpha chain